MKESSQLSLEEILRDAREAKGLSLRDVAERTGISRSHLGYLETGQRERPDPRVLRLLADLYGLALSDLYLAAGYDLPDKLPTFTPYLRSRYHDLPKAAQHELQDSFRRITAKYGYDADVSGPADGEDEN